MTLFSEWSTAQKAKRNGRDLSGRPREGDEPPPPIKRGPHTATVNGQELAFATPQDAPIEAPPAAGHKLQPIPDGGARVEREGEVSDAERVEAAKRRALYPPLEAKEALQKIDPLEFIPVLGGAWTAYKLGRVVSLAGKLEAGTLEEGSEGYQELVALAQEQQERDLHGTTIWHDVVEGIAGSVGFAGDIGAGKVAMKYARRRLGRELAEKVTKETGEWAATQLAREGAKTLGEAAVITAIPGAGRTAAETYRRTFKHAQLQLTETEAGELGVRLDGEMRSFLDSLPEGVAASFFRNFSEGTGELMMPAMRVILGQAASDWIKKGVGRTVQDFFEFTGKVGIQNPAFEIAEERVEAAILAISPFVDLAEKVETLGEFMDEVVPSGRELLVELGTIFGMQAGLSAAFGITRKAADQGPPPEEASASEEVSPASEGGPTSPSGTIPVDSSGVEQSAAHQDLTLEDAGSSPAPASTPAQEPAAPDSGAEQETPESPEQAAEPLPTGAAEAQDEVDGDQRATLETPPRGSSGTRDSAQGAPQAESRAEGDQERPGGPAPGAPQEGAEEAPAEPEPSPELQALRSQNQDPGVRSAPDYADPDVVSSANELEAGVPDDASSYERSIEGPPIDIGGALTGNLKAPEGKLEGGAVNRPKIIKALADVVKAAGATAPIRYGRLQGKPRSVGGVFKVGPEVIRVRSVNDIATAAHEVAHALDKHVFGKVNGVAEAVGSKEAVEELRGLDYDQGLGGRRPYEGWAEFVRHWVTGGTGTLRSKAPKTLEWFEGTFLKENPEVAKALQEARKLTDQWRRQGSVERGKQSLIREGTQTARARRLLRDTRKLATKKAVFDALAPLEALSQFAEERLGRKLEVTEDPHMLADSYRLAHSGITKAMVEDTMVDIAGNPVGPPLAEIRPLVKRKRKEFVLYLYARRARALLEDRKGQRNPGISLEDAQQIIRELETPEFAIAADKVYRWWEGVQNYVVAASPATYGPVLEKIKGRDPGDYVPLQREFEELSGQLGKLAPSAASGKLSKRLLGSGRRVKDPLDSLVSQAEEYVRKAHERMVIDRLVAIGNNVPGVGLYVERVPREKVPYKRSIEQILDDLKRKAPGLHIEIGEDADALEGALTFFTGAHYPKAGEDPIVSVYADGEVQWYQVDEGVYRAIGGMKLDPMNRWADLVFGVPKRAFTIGTTGLKAGFSLLTNPMRDAVTMWHNTRTSAVGPRLFFDYMQRLFHAGLDAASNGKLGADPYREALERLGVTMAQPLNYDSPRTSRATNRLFQGRFRLLRPSNTVDYIRDVFQFPETSARATELKAMAREIGWRPGKPMTLEQAIKLRLAGKRVTVDFSSTGSMPMVRFMARSVPFFSAAVQGLRTFGRTHQERPAQFYLRGLQVTAATLAMWWLLKDEDWYSDMEDDEKFLYWHVPIPGTEEVLRIPRPQEIGGIFAALPEMMMDAWYREDPETARAWGKKMFDVAFPPLLPVLAKEALEQTGNKDFFWDRPIESRRFTYKPNTPPEERFDEYTTRAAKTIGEVFKVSPQRVDHAIRGVFGGLGDDIIDALGMGPERTRQMMEPADAPVIGRLFMRGGTTGHRMRSVERLYDALNAARRIQDSTRLVETDYQRQGRLLVENATEAIQALSYLRSNAKEKDARNALTREMRKIAHDALGSLESIGPHEWSGDRSSRDRLREAMRKRTRAAEAEAEGQGAPR